MKRLLSQISSFLYFTSFISKENHIFNEENNPSQKNVIVEEELDDIDIEDIGNLEELPISRHVFIDEECRNLKAVD